MTLAMGIILMILGAVSKSVSKTTMFWGLLLVVLAAYAKGVIN